MIACSEPALRAGPISDEAVLRQSRGIEARFDGPGVAFRRAAGEGEDVVLRFSGWGGRDADWDTVGNVVPVEDSLGTTYDFGDVQEWWRQEGGGFRQGWTVSTLGGGSSELAFDVAVEGADVELDERGAIFEGESGQLRYGLPVAWDANGADLAAWLEESQGGLRVMVDVEGAVLPITVDPLVEEAVWQAYGHQMNDMFGSAIASAGDVNGDGYDDVLVGAGDYSSGAGGRAYVYFGSATGPGETADWMVESADSSAYFGSGGASAGDVNGDGYDEIIICASQESSDGIGKAYLYYGSTLGPATSEGWVATAGRQGGNNTYLCEGASTAGDVNGDGYDDVLLTHDYSLWDSTICGGYCYYAADLYLGSAAGLGASPDWRGRRTTPPVFFGETVSSAGDVNGDGYDDVLIGTAYWNGADYPGKVQLFLGSPSGLSTTAAWVGSAPNGLDNFGFAVESAGDVNGDGFDDVIIGANFSDSGATNGGAAYVYLGSAAGLTASADWSAASTVADAQFGYDVSGVGDINLDGYDDVVVAAHSNAEGAFLFLGSAAGLSSSASWNVGSTSWIGWGRSVAGAGDVNGDMYADVLVGAPNAVVNLFTGYGDICYIDADGDGYGSTTTEAATSTGCTDAGQSATSTDCDDTNPSIHPNAAEVVADGVDQNCDLGEVCFTGLDADGDGHYSGIQRASTDLDCLDIGESLTGDDCNDANAGISPSDVEIIADTLDQDCDGFDNCYADTDGDSYGSTDLVVTADFDCADAGESWVSTDCDDTTASIRPGGTETAADGIDSDCNGGDLCFVDADLDATGSTFTISSSDMACDASGEAALASDCNDGQPSIYPGAAEVIADTVDQDCDTHELCYLDNDRDSFGSADSTLSVDLDCADVFEASAADDCDDNDDDIYPGGTELPADNVDGDCDSGDLCFADTDGDTFGAADTVASADMSCAETGESAVATDCDDATSTIYPNAPEVTADGIDQDCDAGDTCYQDQDSDGFGTVALLPSIDLDCSDIYESAIATDCDDLSSSAFPAAPEVTADGIDQDCDAGDVCFADVDGDTFGTATTVVSPDLSCIELGESAQNSDCDDASAQIYPAAPEQTANGTDEDCDSEEACYADNDGDTYGTAVLVQSADLTCAAAGLSTENTDCNDADPAFSPGVAELPADGIDQNCDGSDACYLDEDADGYGVEATTPGDLACSGSALVATDCNDADGSVHPDATEGVADSIDQDCDGTELCHIDADHDGYGTDDSITSADADCADLGEAATTGDCDDNSVRTRPGAAETPANGVDENCDGTELCYVDADGDGAGSDATNDGALSCEVANDDCDDADKNVGPSSAEVCNGRDDNCDGKADEGLNCAADVPLFACATAGPSSAGIGAMFLGLVAAIRRSRRTSLG